MYIYIYAYYTYSYIHMPKKKMFWTTSFGQGVAPHASAPCQNEWFCGGSKCQTQVSRVWVVLIAGDSWHICNA